MMLRYKPHIPKTVDELLDQLSFMSAKSPTFQDSLFVGRNIDTAFLQLNEGLKNVSADVGADRYAAMIDLSDRTRAHFEADPQDSNGETEKGRALLHKMQQILEEVSGRN